MNTVNSVKQVISHDTEQPEPKSTYTAQKFETKKQTVKASKLMHRSCSSSRNHTRLQS